MCSQPLFFTARTGQKLCNPLPRNLQALCCGFLPGVWLQQLLRHCSEALHRELLNLASIWFWCWWLHVCYSMGKGAGSVPLEVFLSVGWEENKVSLLWFSVRCVLQSTHWSCVCPNGAECISPAFLGLEDNPRVVLEVMQRYVHHFFGCKACAQHFEEMAKESMDSVQTWDRAVLWLWEKHNVVNSRLAGKKENAHRVAVLKGSGILYSVVCLGTNRRAGSALWHGFKPTAAVVSA